MRVLDWMYEFFGIGYGRDVFGPLFVFTVPVFILSVAAGIFALFLGGRVRRTARKRLLIGMVLGIASCFLIAYMGSRYVRGTISSAELDFGGIVAGGFYIVALFFFGWAYFGRSVKEADSDFGDA